MDNRLINLFNDSPHKSIKFQNYFEIYEENFQKYRNQEIIFVEVGVLDGGSLFMWKNYFGDKARIIGIDLNPSAKKWQDYGFEIYIGDAASDRFWQDFYIKVGKIDILLDDGGHTYRQQIITTMNALKNINDNGLLIIEDTHTSYMRKFGYPSNVSYMNWVYKICDSLTNRKITVGINKEKFQRKIKKISIYNSMVVFSISYSVADDLVYISNQINLSKTEDFRRYSGNGKYLLKIFNYTYYKLPTFLRSLIRKLSPYVINYFDFFLSKIDQLGLRKLF